MKAFEKWFSIFPKKDPFRKHNRDIVAKAAWRAALEWVLSDLGEIESNPLEAHEVLNDLEIDIKQELEQ